MRPNRTGQGHSGLVSSPLAFLSSSFTEREEHWSSYEREPYAVVQDLRKIDYMLSTDPTTRVFSYHRKLLFAFTPVEMEPSLGRHEVLKVVRWALYLSAFNYRIDNVPEDLNTWPDIMTRWMHGYRKTPAVRRISLVIPFNGVTTSPDDPELTWTSLSVIQMAQKDHISHAPKQSTTTDAPLVLIKGVAWVPDGAVELERRLLIIAHAGSAGHLDSDPTFHALRK